MANWKTLIDQSCSLTNTITNTQQYRCAFVISCICLGRVIYCYQIAINVTIINCFRSFSDSKIYFWQFVIVIKVTNDYCDNHNNSNFHRCMQHSTEFGSFFFFCRFGQMGDVYGANEKSNIYYTIFV